MSPGRRPSAWCGALAWKISLIVQGVHGKHRTVRRACLSKPLAATTLSRVSQEQELPRVPIDGAITLASHGAEFENVFYIPDIEELSSFGGALLLIKSFWFLYGLKVL